MMPVPSEDAINRAYYEAYSALDEIDGFQYHHEWEMIQVPVHVLAALTFATTDRWLLQVKLAKATHYDVQVKGNDG